jgi:hypothetical protein
VNLISKLYASFFFFVIFGVFLPDFSSMSLEEFFSIHSMDLGARMNLIIYHQPWSEYMAPTPSIL